MIWTKNEAVLHRKIETLTDRIDVQEAALARLNEIAAGGSMEEEWDRTHLVSSLIGNVREGEGGRVIRNGNGNGSRP